MTRNDLPDGPSDSPVSRPVAPRRTPFDAVHAMRLTLILTLGLTAGIGTAVYVPALHTAAQTASTQPAGTPTATATQDPPGPATTEDTSGGDGWTDDGWAGNSWQDGTVAAAPDASTNTQTQGGGFFSSTPASPVTTRSHGS